MSFEGQGHFFTIFQVLYVLCFARPRYQVSVYRTIGPLVKRLCSDVINFSKASRVTICLEKLEPVVHSIVILTPSLRRQLVKYMLTSLSNTLLFCSHIFSTKVTASL